MRLKILMAGFWLLPLWAEACPRCIQASPYKGGLLWAVLFLLPVPFILAGVVGGWIVRHSKTDLPPL
jgi:hypothetical protein